MVLESWFHTIPLHDGTEIPGRCTVQALMDRIEGVWPDVAGKTVLDIGCSEGFYSFLAEEQGAKSVTAFDYEQENIDRMLYSATLRRSKISIGTGDVMQAIGRQKDRYDIVLFLGVLYHLENPMQALRNVVQKIAPGGVALIETHLYVPAYVDGLDSPRAAANPEQIDVPLMRLWRGDELNNDSSNQWSPNRCCMEAMLQHVGLQIERRHFVKVHSRGAWLCRKAAE